MVSMGSKGFVDPESLLGEALEERMRAFEQQYPEPRSQADEMRIEKERKRLIRELTGARRSAMRQGTVPAGTIHSTGWPVTPAIRSKSWS